MEKIDIFSAKFIEYAKKMGPFAWRGRCRRSADGD